MPASVYVCQGGCGTFEEKRGEMRERGFVNPKLYCVRCVETIDEFLEERDTLHTRLSEEWSVGLSDLVNKYQVDNRRLPDV